jgi:hypothetical protein
LLASGRMPLVTTTSTTDLPLHDAPHAPRAERVTRAEVTAGEPDAKEPRAPEALDADEQDPYDNVACTD